MENFKLKRSMKKLLLFVFALYSFTASAQVQSGVNIIGSSTPKLTVTGTSTIQGINGGKAVYDTSYTFKLKPKSSPVTTTYTAVAGEFIPCDNTSGSFTVTLPTAPADGSRVSVKMVIQGGANIITVATGGTDVFNKVGGSTTGTLTLLNQGFNLQYKSGSPGIWYGQSVDFSLPSLDSRYLNVSNVATSTEITSTENSYNVACWGNSLTAASNLAQDFTNSFPSVLATLSGRVVYNGGIGGESSTQIATRMLAATDKYSSSVIIDAGRNNFASSSTVLADIASMVAALGHTRYVVLAIVNGAGEGNPSTAYTQITSLNATLASTYGANYLDIRSYLVSQYNSGIPQDVTDHTADIPPSSLRTDAIHYTAAGYSLWANYIYSQKASILFPTISKPVYASDISGINNKKTSGDFIQRLNVSGGGITPSMAPTIVTNGTFAGNITGWTSGGNWAYGTNSALHTAGSTATFTQALTTANGAYYFASFQVSGSTVGTVNMTLGAFLGGITSTAGSNITYTCGFFGTGTSATLTFTPTSTFDGAIKNVTVQAMYGLNNATPPVFTINNTAGNDTIPFEIRASQQSLFNYALGFRSMLNNVTGNNNLTFGHFAMNHNLTGSNNIAIGKNSMYTNVSGNNNVAIGLGNLGNIRSGTDNIAIGYNSAIGITSAFHNVAIGASSLGATTTGGSNVAIGFAADATCGACAANTAIGYASMNVVTGSNNTAIGASSGINLASASYNIMIGAWINAPSSSGTGQLNIGNVIYGTGIYSTGVSSSTPTTTGSIGIGLTTPTARLHLPAGTATANTSPLKLTSGTSLTTTEAGAIEFDGAQYYATLTNSGTRFQLARVLSATATLDFPSTTAGTASDLTITVTGATTGDAVTIGVPDGSTLSDGCFTAWVSAANTVKIRFTNNSLTLALDPASGTFKATVINN